MTYNNSEPVVMDITNKQYLSDLIAYMNGQNCTDIILPKPDGKRNPAGDNRIYTDSWQSELFALREADQKHTISIEGDGVYLYGYKFCLDGQKVIYVSMEYDNVCPRGCALLYDYDVTTPADLVNAWLGDTTLDDYDEYEDIITLANIAKKKAK